MTYRPQYRPQNSRNDAVNYGGGQPARGGYAYGDQDDSEDDYPPPPPPPAEQDNRYAGGGGARNYYQDDRDTLDDENYADDHYAGQRGDLLAEEEEEAAANMMRDGGGRYPRHDDEHDERAGNETAGKAKSSGKSAKKSAGGGGGKLSKLMASFKTGSKKKPPRSHSTGALDGGDADDAAYNEAGDAAATGRAGGEVGRAEDGLVDDEWQSNPQLYNPSYDTANKKGGGGGSSAADRAAYKKQVKDSSAAAAAANRRGGMAAQKCRIILLDGEELQLQAEKKANGQALFDEVCDVLMLIERDYFGLTYVNLKEQTWFWLDMNKKIVKQLSNGEDWIFNFQVKFYPSEPSLLQEDITRYQLALQIRQDIYTNKLPCSWTTQALLGSYMVQSEIGDQNVAMQNSSSHAGGPLGYLAEFEFVRNQTDNLLEKIAELHEKHIGLSPAKADMKFLEIAKRLQHYGLDLHPAQDHDGIPIHIGVCYDGVVVYRGATRIGRFAWPKVLRISYRKTNFYLKIRADHYEDQEVVVGFALFNSKLAKRFWKIAVEHHTFFRMKSAKQAAGGGKKFLPGPSNFHYSGRTYYQYRMMNIDRDKPQFERALTKKRTASMPMGLDQTGRTVSMHSMNRAHPRDMTMLKTSPVEYMGPRKFPANAGVGGGAPSYGGGQHNSINRNERAESQYSGSVLSASNQGSAMPPHNHQQQQQQQHYQQPLQQPMRNRYEDFDEYQEEAGSFLTSNAGSYVPPPPTQQQQHYPQPAGRAGNRYPSQETHPPPPQHQKRAQHRPNYSDSDSQMTPPPPSSNQHRQPESVRPISTTGGGGGGGGGFQKSGPPPPPIKPKPKLNMGASGSTRPQPAGRPMPAASSNRRAGQDSPDDDML